jgi:hypothetical protein
MALVNGLKTESLLPLPTHWRMAVLRLFMATASKCVTLCMLTTQSMQLLDLWTEQAD